MSATRCPRDDHGTPCAGELSAPMRGRHTGRWFQTCRRCFETTSTATPPPGWREGPLPLPPLPATWQERLEARDEEER